MTTPTGTYNYATFRPAAYIEGECDGPDPGDFLGDQTVYGLDGEPRRLAEILRRPTVLETASTTCPLYCAQIDPMRQVAESHPDVEFAVLYTREAHPGGRRGPHENMTDKIGAASTLWEAAGEWRTIWIDTIDGRLHRLLSAAPNSVVVLDGAGSVLTWMHDADASTLHSVLSSMEAGLSLRVPAESRFRPPGPDALRALLRGGWKAVGDFVVGLPALVRYRLSGGASC